MHVATTLGAMPVLPSDPVDVTCSLIQDVYRQLGSVYPQRLFAKIIDGEDDMASVVEIKWGQLLRDSQQVACDLQRVVSDNSTDSPISVGILANSGYSYFVNMLAVWLNGWAVQLLSTKNSVAGIESLIKAVETSVLIFDSTHEDVVQQICSSIPSIRTIQMREPDIFQAYEPSCSPAGWSQSRRMSSQSSDSALDRAVIYVHTSGSEGHPKPIALSHRYILADMRQRVAANYAGTTLYSPGPLFHGMSLCAFTRWPITSGVIPIFVTMKKPLTGQTLIRHLKRLPGSITFLTPVLLQDVVEGCLPDLSVLKTCKRVFFGGASLHPGVAATLIKEGVPLVSVFGSTETSVISKLDFPSEDRLRDWQYFRFLDKQYVFHFSPVEDSNVHELIISPGPECTPNVLNHRNPLGFKTNDTWERHPVHFDLWRHAGRKSDVTVLSNGEKTDNSQLASLLLEDPGISSVVVFGSGKPLNGVIISPSQEYTALSRSQFIDVIWPTVARINSIIPRSSKLIPKMILVASAEKPFITTDKTTIRRKETLSLYAEEIKEAYEKLEAGPPAGLADNLTSLQDIVTFVRAVVHSCAETHIADDCDFFSSGLDSLDAVVIRSGVMPLLANYNARSSAGQVPQNLPYVYSTISHLAQYLYDCRSGISTLQSLEERTARVSSCIERFTTNFPQVSNFIRNAGPLVPFTVAITGATGSLGCHLLKELLGRGDVEKIYCLHRGPTDTALHRQTELFQERQISVDLLSRHGKKIEFISIDLSKPLIGLNSQNLQKLQNKTTHVIHTAWELNFNWTLERFEPEHITGIRSLVDLVMTSHRPVPPRFVFLSSIGAVGNYRPSTPVPAQLLKDPNVLNSQGYGQAKYVAERIVERASESGLHATIIRAGQLSGSTINGFWRPSEYMPILLRSSRRLDIIPNNLNDVRWLPTDVAAKCILQLSLHHESSTLKYYNLQNPTSTPWSKLCIVFGQALGIDKSVSFQHWIETVESTAVLDIPAKALLQFYYKLVQQESELVLDMEDTCRICPYVDFGEITDALAIKYIENGL